MMIAGLFPHQQSRTVRENIVYEADLRNPVSSQIGDCPDMGCSPNLSCFYGTNENNNPLQLRYPIFRQRHTAFLAEM